MQFVKQLSKTLVAPLLTLLLVFFCLLYGTPTEPLITDDTPPPRPALWLLSYVSILALFLVFFERTRPREALNRLSSIQCLSLSIVVLAAGAFAYTLLVPLFGADEAAWAYWLGALSFVCTFLIVGGLLRTEFEARREKLSLYAKPLLLASIASLCIYLLSTNIPEGPKWYLHETYGPAIGALLFILFAAVSIILSHLLTPSLGPKRLFLFTILVIFFGFLAINAPFWWLRNQDTSAVKATTSKLEDYQHEVFQKLSDPEYPLVPPDEFSPGSVGEEDVFDVVGVILTVVALGLAAWGLWFQSKIDSLAGLDRRVEDLNGLVVMAAETALAAMPDFSKSQQIPDKAGASLATLHRILFEDDEQRIVTHLRKTGNGLKLHYAHAIYHFGCANFPAAEHFLVDEVLKQGVAGPLRVDALYRLGICQRQQQKWPEAMKTFQSMVHSGNSRARELGLLGIAVTLLAWRPENDDPGWPSVRQQLRSDQANHLRCDSDYRTLGGHVAFLLHKCAPNSTMAKSYYSKYWCLLARERADDARERADDKPWRDTRKLPGLIDELRYHVQQDTGGNDNISINYLMVEAWCDWMSWELSIRHFGRSEGTESLLESARRNYKQVATLAEQYAQRAVEANFSDLIYSEFQEREVQPTEIVAEAELAAKEGVLKGISEKHEPYLALLERRKNK